MKKHVLLLLLGLTLVLSAANWRWDTRLRSGAPPRWDTLRTVTYTSVTMGISLIANNALITNISGIGDLTTYVGCKVTISDGTYTAVGWVKSVGVGPTFGTELATTANAISDPNGNESGTTTGWTPTNLNTFGLSGTTTTGTYAFFLNATPVPTNIARIYKDLHTDWALSGTTGALYRLTYSIRHSGAGGIWKAWLSSSNSDGLGTDRGLGDLASTDTTYTSKDIYYVNNINVRYLIFREGSTSNDGGVYLDNLSCKRVSTPGRNGAIIVSTRGGETQSWSSDTGLNGNATSFTVTFSRN